MQKLDKVIADIQADLPLKSESQYDKFKAAKERLKLRIISLKRTCQNTDDAELHDVLDLKTDL